jgi:hypothetical protein
MILEPCAEKPPVMQLVKFVGALKTLSCLFLLINQGIHPTHILFISNAQFKRLYASRAYW